MTIISLCFFCTRDVIISAIILGNAGHWNNFRLLIPHSRKSFGLLHTRSK